MLAGRMARRKTTRQSPATERVRGTRIPMAPRISQTPVKYTNPMGRGKIEGIMRARSWRNLLKWVELVKRNMAASAKRVQAGQLSKMEIPNAPSARKKSREPNKTKRTIIATPEKTTREGLRIFLGARKAEAARYEAEAVFLAGW
jgi:hypothetical protein